MSLQASDIADESVVSQDEEEVGLLTGRKGKDAPAVIKGPVLFQL